jgi:uncharacterized tellurite resistance protein B-like protein
MSASSTPNPQFQLGLLHFAHLLMNADGSIDEREEGVLQKIKEQEGISDKVYTYFEAMIRDKPERKIYDEGVDMLNSCTEDERLTAFVYLYQLALSDDNIHEKEVRLLLYSLEATNIAFEDVKRIARASKLG